MRKKLLVNAVLTFLIGSSLKCQADTGRNTCEHCNIKNKPLFGRTALLFHYSLAPTAKAVMARMKMLLIWSSLGQ